jgi:hypothetical protein
MVHGGLLGLIPGTGSIRFGGGNGYTGAAG